MPPAIALISHRQRFEIVGITIGRFSLGPAFSLVSSAFSMVTGDALKRVSSI
jgi:hypothetical protein